MQNMEHLKTVWGFGRVLFIHTNSTSYFMELIINVILFRYYYPIFISLTCIVSCGLDCITALLFLKRMILIQLTIFFITILVSLI